MTNTSFGMKLSMGGRECTAKDSKTFGKWGQEGMMNELCVQEGVR